MCIECLEKKKTYTEKSKCDHGKRKSDCKECGGSSLCEHDRRKTQCKDCKGGSICEHGRQRVKCRECGGSAICGHNIERTKCKECGGGSICSHNRQRIICKECGGSAICEHKKQKRNCKECDFTSYLSNIVRGRVRDALKLDKELSSTEYLCCGIEYFKSHIEDQFDDNMSWDNYGEWHIDHITPIKYKKNGKEPTLEEVIDRLHYTNTQPLWAEENRSKGNRYVG